MKTHTCGGTILMGGAGEYKHYYCATCKAYVYADTGTANDVPNGTDRLANRKAWDSGAVRSPDLVETCAECGEYYPCSVSNRTDLRGLDRAKHVRKR